MKATISRMSATASGESRILSGTLGFGVFSVELCLEFLESGPLASIQASEARSHCLHESISLEFFKTGFQL